MIAGLDPKAQPVFTAMCEALDKALGEKKYIVFEGRRTKAVQEAYYAQGRQSLAEVNALRKKAGLYLFTKETENAHKITWTMKSKHLDGLAMDIVPTTPEGNPTWDLNRYIDQFKTIRDCGRDAGLDCGGYWDEAQRDWPHYQLKEQG
jgi:peptidoglycan L-alanyl-D-glutamate endopeptidase CwlK